MVTDSERVLEEITRNLREAEATVGHVYLQPTGPCSWVGPPGLRFNRLTLRTRGGPGR